MARYIDADEALKIIDNYTKTITEDGKVVAKAIRDIVEIICPESEVVKVKHGKWKECFEDWRKQIAGDECSVCGFQHYGTSITNYNYCPNCGAKMDGGEKQ